MPALCLDPLVHGCSRRRARKLIRATRKHPLASTLPAPVTTWLLATRTPLTPQLHAALLLATQTYPASQWHGSEFKQLAAAVTRGVTLDNIELWSWLRGDGDVDIPLRGVPASGFPFPAALAEPFLGNWTWSSRTMVELAWRLCIDTPRLAHILTHPDFTGLSPLLQSWFLDMCLRPGANPAPLLPAIQPGSEQISSRFLAKASAPAALALLQQYPKLRATEQTGVKRAAELVENLPPKIADAVARFSPVIFTRIAKARCNQQIWYETVDALAPLDGDTLIAALATRPELLFELGARLNAFGPVRSKRLLQSAKDHALFRPMPPITKDPNALVALDHLLTAHRDLALTLPAFSTWDRHFSGEKPLSRPAIEDVGEQLIEGLTALRLRHLIQQIDTEIALCGDSHAGLLRAGLKAGRHPLRRFLRAHAAGADPRLTHPANRRWLAQRPDFPIETWLHPLRITLPVNGLGDVTLEVETNPFELLRLGTYARSCLAAGASNSANTVAVLLDVNKRAIYARNANGRFLARQIVAISDDGHFVAHNVYPRKSPKALEDFFQLFVEDWAMQLRLPIARGGWNEVAALAVPRWYDDGIWDRYWPKDEA